MADSFTVRTRQSWRSRLGGSIKSVLFGLILFLAAFPVIFCNEGRAVKTARSLDEGAGAVASISPDLVDPSMDGKLVHVSGATTTEETLEDPTFGASANAIKLARHVEMYQWKQSSTSKKEKNLGGSEDTATTYSYEKAWSSELIDSSDFERPDGHQNPPAMPYQDQTVVAERVTLGAFRLSPEQIGRLNESSPLSLDRAPSLGRPATVRNGVVLLGADPESPTVGDARVRFSTVNTGIVSLVAQQRDDNFQAYQTRAGDRISMVTQSMRSAESMFDTAKTANVTLTWMLRIVSFLMMFLGLAIVLKPISILGDVVPLVGNLLGTGIGLTSASLALFFSMAAIAISWILVRPVLGIAMGVVAVGVLLWAVRRARRSRQSGARPGGGSSPPPVPPIPV